MLEQTWQWILDTANQEFLFGVLAAFIIGFIVGLFIRHRKKKGARLTISTGDNAFFKGFQYLLSDDHDHAIEEFTKSVQVNSDTIETYVALGNLYRSKGDIDRAIHIRQTIILRPNISEQIKLRALFDLGLDYKKGGLLDRALETFLNVLKKQPSNVATLEEIEKIYEEMKDWENAFSIRQKLSKLVRGKHNNILAHHQTELGKKYADEGEHARAKASFKKAISIHKGCVDAYLHLGDLYFSNQDYKKAMATWKSVVRISPNLTFLAYRRLEGAYSKMQNLKPVEAFLKECAEFNSDAFTHLALARYLYNAQDYDGALKEIESALDLNPSFWEARAFLGEILIAGDRKEEAVTAYKSLIPHLNIPYLKFQCSNCGFIPADLQWQCPQCKRWDTIKLKNYGMNHLPNSVREDEKPSELSNGGSKEDQ
jgi:lipopolysaccharide biosynthesis regulator YciM